MPHFTRLLQQVHRQPLDQSLGPIARAARTAIFPARFMLVGAMNPCPCGFAGDAVRECRCTPQQTARYRGRLSGPLRDRLDLTVEVAAVPPHALAEAGDGEPSAAIRARVAAARDRQRTRYAAPQSGATNAALTPALMAEHCRLDRDGLRVLASAVSRLGLTARGYDRVRKVARTIADLAGAETIGAHHIAEAIQFRIE
jgi:magnesium chelatase family protein